VDLPTHKPIELPAPEVQFTHFRELNDREIENLKDYITKYRDQLGASGEIGFNLTLTNQRNVGKRLYVRFAQQIVRQIGSHEYFLPIEGAGIVAFIDQYGLSRLNSKLMTPVSLGPSFKNPGFKFNLSNSELAALMMHLKTSEEPRELVKKYFAGIAARANLHFDFDIFLNRQLSEQRETLDYFFGSLGSVATARILIDLARNNQLALIAHGPKWMFQVSEFFHLPIEFDIEIPQSEGDRLTIKNLRDLHTSSTAINGFQSPNFPGGEQAPGGPSVEVAKRRLTTVMNYFSENFSWPSYRGKGIEHDVELHTKLRSIDYRENAAWLVKQEKFVVGEGGDTLTNLENSLSVLGHEFTHAVVQFSSGLKYRSDSGAINEHIADIMGATIDSIYQHQSNFTYHVGADILSPPVLEQKKQLSELIIAKYKFTADEIGKYDLKTPSLRHLYAPKLSFAAQFDDFDKLRKAYPINCQASIDNDHCGIHLASGVLNRATSLIVSNLGILNTQQMFFNTAMYRLTPSASFVDYLIQLYDECLETLAIAGRCDIILKSFATVGIIHPRFSDLLRPPDVPINHLNGETSVEHDAPADKKTKHAYAASPVLKFCGWVDPVDDELIRLVDGKYNATVVRKNHELLSVGDYQSLLDWKCACAVGHITHISDGTGGIINAFLDIHSVENRRQRCANEPKLRVLRPSPRTAPVASDEIERTLCGWVSVNSKNENITLIDGKINALLIATVEDGMERTTQGDFGRLRKAQCACVTGKTTSTTTSSTMINGSRSWFTSIWPEGIVLKLTDACTGIRWQ
jgi:hypothetical protein